MFLTENAVREVLTYNELIPAIRKALIDYSAGRVQQPPRMVMRAGNAEGHRNGWLAVMPAIHNDVMGVKTVTFYPGNADLGLHTHMAMVEPLDRTTGKPLAVMDGRLITEMRTAAVSAAAFQVLASLHFERPPQTFGIIGSGVQARAHVQALRLVWPEMEDIWIWSPTRAHAEKCASELNGRPVEIQEAASAEVVLTATLSAQPVLQGRWLRRDAMILAIGGIGPANRELDDEVVHTSFVVAESRDCVTRESGDVVCSGAAIGAEMGEILAQPDPALIPRNRPVLFKSVGMAIEDLTAARLVWEARKSPPEYPGSAG